MKKGGFLQRVLRIAEAPQPRPTIPSPACTTENYQLTGVQDHLEAVMSLAVPNSEYRKTKKELQAKRRVSDWIYEYTFPLQQAELVPEPDNPQNPKAVKVMVHGACVGYIKSGSCARVLKLLQADRVARVTCELGGGKRKILTPDSSSVREAYVLEQDRTIIWAKVSLHLLPEK